MKKWMRFVFACLISAVFLWFAFKDIKWAEALDQMRTANHQLTFLSFALVVLINIIKIQRWHLLLRPFVEIGRRDLYRIGGLGFLLVMLLPLRLGEFSRPYLLKKEKGASFSSVMATIALERAFDGLFVTLMFFAVTNLLLSSYSLPGGLTTAASLAFALLLGVFLFLVVAFVAEEKLMNLIRATLGRVHKSFAEKIVDLGTKFVKGLRLLPDLGTLSFYLFWTAAYWLLNGVSVFALTEAFGFELPLVASLLVVCVLVIGIMIPAGPGFLGTFQGAIILGLSIFDVEQTAAAAFVLVYYPLSLMASVLLALPYFITSGLDVRGVIGQQEDS